MSWRRGVGGALVAAAAATAAFYKKGDDDNLKTNVSVSTQSSVESLMASNPASCNNLRLQGSIKKATELCERVQRQLGLPGMSIAVAVNGRMVFQQGFGYSDLENGVPMTPQSVIRIASISKPMTMAMLAQLIEQGKVDINLPIQHYLTEFPQKTFEGQNVTITTRHLLSHLSGIRHYKTKAEIAEDEKRKKENKAGNDGGSDAEFKEFFQKTGCDDIAKSLEMFKNDELIHKPGTKYFYTTHGWTVVSAVIEKASGVAFDKHAKRMFAFWGLNNTYLDQNDPIIPNRSRHYVKDKKNGHSLKNAPYVDNSCKWAGGGFISSVVDLVRFAHIMMYSAQQAKDSNVKGFLKQSTVDELWTGDKRTAQPHIDNLYGQGWVVGDKFSHCAFCNGRDAKAVHHSGGAVGATSILFIQLPENEDSLKCQCDGEVKGVVVAMITNLIDAGLGLTAKQIAQEFKWMI